ncbi:MAG: sigma-70 family RNA polymerase sigma factor [Candidatus Pacebacteria bacterium]|nr:sigma-70 family RNA polymerase sigma factor [Candidatus Paceibacterota bacterium]MBP9840021.1 sigma-70 family RNA polymerase sigma factor [Candidatus Paceibacterota bacterium]
MDRLSSEDPRSDEEILRASARNPELFRILVRRYEAAFTRKALTILRVPEDAEEVVQDTFTRIYLYADRYQAQEGAKFSSWAYTILTRLAFTRYQSMKKRRTGTVPLDPEHYESLRDTDDFVETLTHKDEVIAALASLPESASRVLTLQFLEGKTQEEVAEVEGSSVPAVKTRVHRAKKLFKQAYDDQHAD